MIDQGFVWVNKFDREDEGQVWVKVSPRTAYRMSDGEKFPCSLDAPPRLHGAHSYWCVLPKELLVR